MVEEGIFMINQLIKEIWSILQLPMNFPYTIDARVVKNAFMISVLARIVVLGCAKINVGSAHIIFF